MKLASEPATTRFVDHLVIGGGPAGCMLALRLAAAGRRVTLVEKERGAHHKVCGEFLSPEAVHYIRQVGIDLCNLGAAEIKNLRISSGNKVVEATLPFQALSLSRRSLDEALLTRAAELGSEILRGAQVHSLASDGNAWTAILANGKRLRTNAVFLATGKHDLHGHKRPAGKQNDLIGFKLHWRLGPLRVATLRHSMDLFVFSGGYGGLSLVEGDTANLCLVVRRSMFCALGGWPQMLADLLAHNVHLTQLLDGAEPLFRRPLAISPIPYGYLATEDHGLWPIGDQAAVIPSFTGDGISIALHSAALAADYYLAGMSPQAYLCSLRGQLRRSMVLATRLSRTAVTEIGRGSALLAVSFVPGVMRLIAASTRISNSVLRTELSSSSPRCATSQGAPHLTG